METRMIMSRKKPSQPGRLRWIAAGPKKIFCKKQKIFFAQLSHAAMDWLPHPVGNPS
jgi:hypothetical protein